MHPGKTSDAASNDCDPQKRGFRYAPKFFLRHTLVGQHNEKANSIDYKEVEENNC